MKEFLNEMKPKKVKKMDKVELSDIILDYQMDVIEFYVKKNHLQKVAPMIEELFAVLANKKVAKAFKTVCKTEDADMGLAVVFNAFLVKNAQDLEDEVVDIYIECINKLLKKKIKKITSKTNLSFDCARDLLAIAPGKQYISNEDFIGLYVNKMLTRLYNEAKENKDVMADTKEIKNLFKIIFGKELLDVVAVNILLQKKEYMNGLNEDQLTVWNNLTTFALDTIEAEEKGHVVELVEYYIQRRNKDDKKGRDAARRISLASVQADDYKRIAKVVQKMSKDQKVAKFL